MGEGEIVRSVEERWAALDRELQTWLAEGWRVEERSQFQVRIAKRRWWGHRSKRTLSADEDGTALVARRLY